MTNDDTKMPEPMSKEEMIDTLKGLVFGTFDRTTAKEREALDMAIKALEQQPCEDCISRQAVLDIINFEDEWLHDANSHNADTKIAFSGLESRVKELPSVTPKTVTDFADKCQECGRILNDKLQARWIPVSERLPEEAYGCIVTVMDTNPMTLEEFENIYPDFVGWDGENWNDADGDSIPFEVIAWMPLPQPYKSESKTELGLAYADQDALSSAT